jgi:hypothetical protein
LQKIHRKFSHEGGSENKKIGRILGSQEDQHEHTKEAAKNSKKGLKNSERENTRPITADFTMKMEWI